MACRVDLDPALDLDLDLALDLDLFRNTTWASLDQEGSSLATIGAQTEWPPKIFLGYFGYKLLPLEKFTFMGGLCN